MGKKLVSKRETELNTVNRLNKRWSEKQPLDLVTQKSLVKRKMTLLRGDSKNLMTVCLRKNKIEEAGIDNTEAGH